ncbi:MAG: penicillin-binding transpeptidase domain-containing protein [Abditibacteriales bacterium]|nr:penicillin-binding transpeptidase domain-containing protein [Abditibacteriales bacterium]MDW8368406.1 penicillin-binding transpeptidase domain-containing protein [Abditibacteriales bacterium]
MKQNIVKLAILFFAAYGVLVGFLTYWQVAKSDALMEHPRNRRLALRERRIQRGGIYDRHGQPIAQSQFVNGEQRRVYTDPPAVAHLVGYVSERYGRVGLEGRLDRYLSGMSRDEWLLELQDRIFNRQRRGNDAFLTIDLNVQRRAAAALAGRRGAVVALQPQTGEVLALVSAPSYDPAQINAMWDALQRDRRTPLLNRATLGLYPPGSTFKVVTLCAALENNVVKPDETFRCLGATGFGAYTVHEPNGRAHGRVNLTKALVVSCNVTFSQLAVRVGQVNFQNLAREFGLDGNIAFDLPMTTSSLLRQGSTMTTSILAQSGFGQGEIVVTPMQMALIAATIANDGVMMQPYLIKQIRSPEGEILMTRLPQPLRQAVQVGTAREAKAMMTRVVSDGTTRRIMASLGVRVAAKTGTAQNPHGKPHAWYIAFAPADKPTIAVAVVVENAGAGSAVAAPVARDVIAAWRKETG